MLGFLLPKIEKRAPGGPYSVVTRFGGVWKGNSFHKKTGGGRHGGGGGKDTPRKIYLKGKGRGGKEGFCKGDLEFLSGGFD